MADKHGAHQTTEAYVVSLCEDYCKAPGSPVGYMISQKLNVSHSVCETVHGCQTPVLNMKSRISCVTGDEAGVGGGVVSGVNIGICKPVALAAPTVRAEGDLLLRDGTIMEMNCSSADGPGNALGILKYVTQAPPESVTRDTQPPVPPICYGTPQPVAPWMWVDIDLNDVIHAVTGVACMPLAMLLRGVASIFPDEMSGLLKALPTTSAGTEDKSGLGAIVGNNSGNGTPGAVGLAFSLAHVVLSPFDTPGGTIDGARFEKGQGLEGHDGKTGVGSESNSVLSFLETMGQLFGVIARKLGVGDMFYKAVSFLLGEPSTYGFVAGVWKGAVTQWPLS